MYKNSCNAIRFELFIFFSFGLLYVQIKIQRIFCNIVRETIK